MYGICVILYIADNQYSSYLRVIIRPNSKVEQYIDIIEAYKQAKKQVVMRRRNGLTIYKSQHPSLQISEDPHMILVSHSSSMRVKDGCNLRMLVVVEMC